MRKSDSIYITQLAMLLALVGASLYLAFTIEVYPLNYVWFLLIALLAIIGIMRGLLPALLTSIFVLFAYGSWILYRLYIEQTIADLNFNDLIWLFLYPVTAIAAGMLGRDLLDISRKVTDFEQTVHERITTDDVTGFLNARQFKIEYDEEYSRAQRYQRPMTMMLIEIAHYRDLWKSYGKETSNRILQQISEQITAILRDVDKKAYLGDGLFAVILPETPLSNAAIVKSKLHERMEAAELQDLKRRRNLKIKLKVGAAGYPDDGDDPMTIYDKAKVGLTYDIG